MRPPHIVPPTVLPIVETELVRSRRIVVAATLDHSRCDPPHYSTVCGYHHLPVDHTDHPIERCNTRRTAAAGFCETSVKNDANACTCATRTFTWYTFAGDGKTIATVTHD